MAVRIAAIFLAFLTLTQVANAASCFTYDALGRIIEATYENGTKFTYSYDPNGNRTTTSVLSGQTPTCPDPGGYGENTAPTAVADSSTARPTIVQSIPVRTNDTDPDGDPIALSTVSTPTKGTAVIANGYVEYTANSGATGTDSFTYTISDGRGGSATATVNITAFVANSAPVAVADAATVAPTVATTLDVRANDTDADGDTLTITNVSTPAKGTTSISNGDIIYTANANTTGTDTFNYTVIDGVGGSSTVTSTITINRPPVAVADSASASPTVAATINVRANDTDPDNDPLTVAGATTPTKGTANVSSNNVVYTANAATTGTDTFTYTVADGKGGSASGTITVTISSNQPPVAVDDYITVETPGSMTFDPRYNDSDPNSNPMTITGKTNGSYGAVTILGGGTALSYAASSYIYSEFEVDQFTYTISDGNGGTATATVMVDLTPSCTPAQGYYPPSPPCW